MGGIARGTIQDKASIQQGLREAMSAVTDWVESQPPEHFEKGPEGRWSVGQHLEHLVRSVQPVALGMATPRPILRLFTGAVSRPGMSYTAVLEGYEATLEAGGKASGRYDPPPIAATRRPRIVARHRALCATLVKRIGRWPEEALDCHGAPHPLMGLLSLREVLFFTIHHHDHHFATLTRDYGG